ncbi:hypothetical protein GOP47_0011895 [Adiantum capillus-veneris]|uniref:Uncharacterized protein n=1 Tax=Adiantum capillus-veneris TaxID=13818 RepID=A0A9D4ZH77_ADICA|nr:hypothetical protein GOP47_0011895 [Adiantum capillus-veneris]
MPRPGPRPYECIRRAWHSDSHQPLRGTLIHEIFRLVNELHSTSTRRKKEWQEKLPIVVLRAEEILYSKANSEGEYADVETLRSRLDDAVNTMIRREDGEEEGLYLVPCVEAALSLGCVPKKTPRSQRQGSSRQLLNVARRVAPAVRHAGKEDGNVAIYMDSLCSHSCSTFGLMTQTVPLHDPDLHSLPHTSNSSFCPVGAFWGPNPCHARDTTGSILPRSTSFPKTLDPHHPVVTALYPKQGALVQFLRETNASRFLGDSPLDVPLFGSPQKNFNVQELRPQELLDPAERSGTRMASRFLNGYTATCPSDNRLSHTNPRLPWDGCADDFQKTGGPGGASSEWGINLQANKCSSNSVNGLVGSVPKAERSLLTIRCKSDKALNNTVPTLSTNNNSTTSLWGDHDLQLRLGPPTSEHFAMPVPPTNASAPKRTRVDVLN